jgi:hypothetical protein
MEYMASAIGTLGGSHDLSSLLPTFLLGEYEFQLEGRFPVFEISTRSRMCMDQFFANTWTLLEFPASDLRQWARI